LRCFARNGCARGAIGRRFGRWGRYVCFGLFFVALINLDNILSWSFDPEIDLLTSVIAFVILVLVAPVGEWLAERALSLWIFPRYAAAHQEITLIFADDGIRSQHSGMEGKFPWSAVTGVYETEDYLFLAISRAEMLVVPRRALPSPDDAAALAHYIKSKVTTTAAS
jgi:hypothetical protein